LSLILAASKRWSLWVGPLEAASQPGVSITGDATDPLETAKAALFFFSSSAALRPTLEGGHVAGGKSDRTPGRNQPTCTV
jgi:hypothetical protein